MASPGIYCHWYRVTKEGKPISMSNQNPFADPSVISFADLRERILQNDALNFPRRREIASAINTAANWFSLPLEMVPASASFLRDRFKHVHPAKVNVSRRRIQNVRSLLMAGFRAEGITTKLAPYMTQMSPGMACALGDA